MGPVSSKNILDELTPDDFVGAVMRTHDRIRSNLNALKRGATVSPAGEPPDDARVISVYCLHHGVETNPRPGRHAEPRWLAV